MKYIFILFILSISSLAYAQPEVKVSAKPQGPSEFVGEGVPSFSFTEPFTLIVDVSGVPNLSGVEPIYIWGFIEGCCSSPLNTSFSESQEASRMTKVADNVWSYEFASVKSYMNVSYKAARDAAVSQGRSPEETRFGFLVKAKNGSGGLQSANINIPFTGPIYIKEEFEIFPINSSQKDVITFTYNQDLEDDESMKGEAQVYLYASAVLSTGDIIEPVSSEDVSSTSSLKLTKNGSAFKISIIPEIFFNLDEDDDLSKLRILIQGESGPDVNFGDTKEITLVKTK